MKLEGVPRLPEEMEINGVRFSGIALVHFFDMITNPNPNRWYKFERKDNLVTVTTKTDGEMADHIRKALAADGFEAPTARQNNQECACGAYKL